MVESGFFRFYTEGSFSRFLIRFAVIFYFSNRFLLKNQQNPRQKTAFYLKS